MLAEERKALKEKRLKEIVKTIEGLENAINKSRKKKKQQKSAEENNAEALTASDGISTDQNEAEIASD